MMQQLEFSFVPSRCPLLRPDQALLLWELVEAIAQALWEHYEHQIVEHIIKQNQTAEHQTADQRTPAGDFPF